MLTRFNGKTPAADETRSYFDLTRFYKIWFSPKPDKFLGIENELRFIRMRKNYPNATLYFIYSAQCLHEGSLTALQVFCEQHDIIPVEFEAIEKDLNYSQDKALFALAREEIRRNLNQTGGNMASAADCARAMLHLIKNYNIYSDFDVESQLSELQAEVLSLRSQFILPATILPIGNNKVVTSANCDFFAVGYENQKLQSFSLETIVALQNLQETIIANYAAPLTWDILSPNVKLKKVSMYANLEAVFTEFHKRYPENPNIFDFRLYVASLPMESKNDRALKAFLIRCSVVSISGPDVYPSLFKHLFPAGIQCVPASIQRRSPQWLPFLKLFERSGISFYDQLVDLVNIKNAVCFSLQPKACDLSWTESGMGEKQAREMLIENAAVTIQKSLRRQLFWRENCKEESFLFNVKKICSENLLLTPIQEKNYALALRRACSQMISTVVLLLLKYKENRWLDFDINATSETNKNTALDWLLQAQIGNNRVRSQQYLITQMRAAGALTADEKLAQPPLPTL